MAQLNHGSEKVRPGLAVQITRVQNEQRLTGNSLQFVTVYPLVLPNSLKQLLGRALLPFAKGGCAAVIKSKRCIKAGRQS